MKNIINNSYAEILHNSELEMKTNSVRNSLMIIDPLKRNANANFLFSIYEWNK